jgi:hypothetical protein
MGTHQQHIVLNHKLALKLSLIINILLGIFVFIGIIFSDVNLYEKSITQGLLIVNVSRFITGVFITFLLFEYCFWGFRKKWKIRKKLSVVFFGTFALT